jgi:hypothetical protein
MDQFEKFLDKHFPPSMRQKATDTFKPCVDGASMKFVLNYIKKQYLKYILFQFQQTAWMTLKSSVKTTIP